MATFIALKGLNWVGKISKWGGMIGTIIPAGLLIGTVSAVRTENGGQVTYGIVSPSSKLASLSQVFIIKDFAVVE